MDDDLRHTLAGVEDRHWWFEGRRRILEAVLRLLPLPADATLLEVGCGSGANLPVLARFGQTSACEPDAADRARAAGRGLARVVDGRLPADLPFAGERFDVVAVLDVLEHVEEDAAALAALHDRVRPGGFLLLTVPAHPWLWSDHDVRNHHRRRYRRRDLRRRLTEAGFHLRKLAWFNGFLFPAAAAVRLMGPGSAGTRVPPAPLNALLTAVLGAEAPMVARGLLPAGLSLLAVAERSGTGPDRPRTAEDRG